MEIVTIVWRCGRTRIQAESEPERNHEIRRTAFYLAAGRGWCGWGLRPSERIDEAVDALGVGPEIPTAIPRLRPEVDGVPVAGGPDPDRHVIDESEHGGALLRVDPTAVRDALLSMQGETFYGPFKFDANGVNRLASLNVSQIVQGEPKVIFPVAVKQADPVYPRPGW